MDTLFIEKTEDTPKILLNPEQNKFIISERSLPENAIEFYQPVFDWFANYMNNPNPTTNLDMQLEYFNTATAKQIAKLLILMEKLSVKSDVTIRWHYEQDDADMQASGSRYAKLINVNFEFIEH